MHFNKWQPYIYCPVLHGVALSTLVNGILFHQLINLYNVLQNLQRFAEQCE